MATHRTPLSFDAFMEGLRTAEQAFKASESIQSGWKPPAGRYNCVLAEAKFQQVVREGAEATIVFTPVYYIYAGPDDVKRRQFPGGQRAFGGKSLPFTKGYLDALNGEGELQIVKGPIETREHIGQVIQARVQNQNHLTVDVSYTAEDEKGNSWLRDNVVEVGKPPKKAEPAPPPA